MVLFVVGLAASLTYLVRCAFPSSPVCSLVMHSFFTPKETSHISRACVTNVREFFFFSFFFFLLVRSWCGRVSALRESTRRASSSLYVSAPSSRPIIFLLSAISVAFAPVSSAPIRRTKREVLHPRRRRTPIDAPSRFPSTPTLPVSAARSQGHPLTRLVHKSIH